MKIFKPEVILRALRIRNLKKKDRVFVYHDGRIEHSSDTKTVSVSDFERYKNTISVI